MASPPTNLTEGAIAKTLLVSTTILVGQSIGRKDVVNLGERPFDETEQGAVAKHREPSAGLGEPLQLVPARERRGE